MARELAKRLRKLRQSDGERCPSAPSEHSIGPSRVPLKHLDVKVPGRCLDDSRGAIPTDFNRHRGQFVESDAIAGGKMHGQGACFPVGHQRRRQRNAVCHVRDVRKIKPVA